MPEWLTIFLAILGGGILTGAGAFLRSIGQNKNEQNKLASDDRAAWMTYQGAQIENLIKRNETLEARLNAQVEKQAAHSAAHSAEITELQRQNREQADQMIQLRDQNAQQAAQIATLTEENTSKTQRLNTEIAKNDFMERENGELRREIERMKPLLPIRIEVTE